MKKTNDVPSDNKSWKEKARLLDLSNYQIRLILAAVIIAVIVFLVPFERPWATPVMSILSSILAAVICTASLNIYEKRHQIKYDEHNALYNKIDEIKTQLTMMHTDVKKICTEKEFDTEEGFDKLYENSKNSTSVLIHGRTFIRTHKKAIISRFNKDGFVTKWFFVDPNSEFLGMVSKKTNHPLESIKGFIAENVDSLINEYRNSERLGSLEIFYMSLPPMQAVYIFDDKIIECKYYSSCEKGPSSYVIIYDNTGSKGGIGGGFVADCSKIESDSQCIFSSYVDSDKQFMTYLKGMFESFVIKEWLYNRSDKLEFISATANNNDTILFSYRYFKDDADFERNYDFSISQFKKKEENNKEQFRLFFVTGIGGGPSNPSRITIYQYGKDNSFIVKSSKRVSRIKQLFLKDFGFDHKMKKWK